MKPTQEQVIAWMEEASDGRQPDGWGVMLDREQLERFAALAYKAGRKDENEANKDRIETLYMMYKQASQQRNELAQQQTEALRARLAQPVQNDEKGKPITYWGGLAQPEPLPAKSKGALSHEENKQHNKKILDKFYEENAHLYTAPPQREWQGLTDEEIKEIVGPWGSLPVDGYTRKLFDQIEAKLKEKNT